MLRTRVAALPPAGPHPGTGPREPPRSRPALLMRPQTAPPASAGCGSSEGEWVYQAAAACCEAASAACTYTECSTQAQLQACTAPLVNRARQQVKARNNAQGGSPVACSPPPSAGSHARLLRRQICAA